VPGSFPAISPRAIAAQPASPSTHLSAKDVDVAPWSTGPRATAVAAALAPYAWRDLTGSMLARRVLAAADRYSVVRLIHSVPGAAVGQWEPLGPADGDDPRVRGIASSLRGRGWRGWSVERVCVDLLTALDARQAERDSVEAARGRMLDDH
jgi:hypothetical protein